MSEKVLIERGAECVAGDLILNRRVVGQYRHGQFILTPDGADEVNNVVEVRATSAAADAPKAPKSSKAAKAAKGADVTDVEPKAGPSVDDLVSGLDEALGA